MHLILELEVLQAGHWEEKMKVKWEEHRAVGTISTSWAPQGGWSDNQCLSLWSLPLVVWRGCLPLVIDQAHPPPRSQRAEGGSRESRHSPRGSSHQKVSLQIIWAAPWLLLHFHPQDCECLINVHISFKVKTLRGSERLFICFKSHS